MTVVHLYLKTHRTTGMKYFGKTTKDPQVYQGSGVFWRKHLRKHGNDVETSVVASFDDDTQRDALMEFALWFSRENHIVESSAWANILEEDGLAGKPVGAPGYVPTEEQRIQHANNSRAMWQDPEYRARLQQAQTAAWASRPERRAALTEFMRNQPESQRQAHSEWMRKYHQDKPEGGWEIGKLPKSQAHREAISKALRGRKRSPESRARIRAAALRRKPKIDEPEVLIPDFDRPAPR